jgi:6-phosphogluconolactonase
MNRRQFTQQLTLGAAVAGGALSDLNSAEAPDSMWVYIGTYTRGESRGIYAFRLNMKTGELTPKGLAAETVSPSFLAIHQNGRFLYAANETGSFKGSKSGGVSAFSIDRESGKLTLLNDRLSGGGGPCHLVVDKTGRNVLVANYGGGSVSVLPIGRDGRLGEATAFVQHEGSSVNPRRQKGPHAHSINVSNDNRHAVVADLGMDKIMVYRFDAEKGTLEAGAQPFAKTKPGGGPRHFAFHPNGKLAFTNLEMTSEVTPFAYAAGNGGLEAGKIVSTLPNGPVPGNSTAEVRVHPGGKFLYCSNRGHNSIAVFRIDRETGALNRIQNESTGGEIPRNFGIDPTGRFLLAANQKTGNVVVFRIDQKTGKLKPTGHSAKAPMAVCVKFL